jgi:hypothetical protein
MGTVFTGQEATGVADCADVLNIGFNGFAKEGLLEGEHVYERSALN